MRLFEAIVDANNRALSGEAQAEVHVHEYADSLPIVALTCIDPRLNPLFPGALGVPAEKFIWLRNAGNIITSPLSSTMRSLALACAIKGGREIAILGHTDCQVCKSSVMQLTDRFKALGIPRANLPENIVEYFGLFASERQNVMKACEFVRSSPLIGPAVPVHGLLIDITNGKLEWVVNGYQSFATSTAPAAAMPTSTLSPIAVANPMPIGSGPATSRQESAALSSPTALARPSASLDTGEMKFPEMKIGEAATAVQQAVTTAEKLAAELKHHEWRLAAKTGGELKTEAAEAAREFSQVAREVRQLKPAQLAAELERRISKAGRYKIIGGDKRQYGPISGGKLLEWLLDDRVGADTPVQLEGTTTWQTISSLAGIPKPPPIPSQRAGRDRTI